MSTDMNAGVVRGGEHTPFSRPKVRVGPRSKHEKKTEVRLQKNGSTIESIKVICACGEETVIQCVYPDKT